MRVRSGAALTTVFVFVAAFAVALGATPAPAAPYTPCMTQCDTWAELALTKLCPNLTLNENGHDLMDHIVARPTARDRHLLQDEIDSDLKRIAQAIDICHPSCLKDADGCSYIKSRAVRTDDN